MLKLGVVIDSAKENTTRGSFNHIAVIERDLTAAVQ
jgi:hypothetical protein